MGCQQCEGHGGKALSINFFCAESACLCCLQEMVEVAQKLGPGIIASLDKYISSIPVTS